MDKIRYMQTDDRAFWYSLDNHLPEAEFIKKVQNRQGYVFLNDDRPVGLLRYNLFWDNTPFCIMLFVDSAFQRKLILPLPFRRFYHTPEYPPAGSPAPHRSPPG